MRTGALVALVPALLAAVAAGTTPGAPAAVRQSTTLSPTLATADAASINALVYQKLVPLDRARAGWTGNTDTCDAGTISPRALADALDAVNTYRAIVDLEPVTFDTTLSEKAQAAALIMASQRQLSHFPPTTWSCWSQAGYEGASRSLLHLGSSGIGQRSFMDDYGANNTEAGHRRWLLDPAADVFGFGATDRSSALYTSGSDTVPADVFPDWTAWPPPGNVPAWLEPQGRWSLHSNDFTTDFDNAKVSVVGPGGPMTVVQEPEWDCCGTNGVVWDISGLPSPEDIVQPLRYHVTVTGAADDSGAPLGPVDYDVTLLPYPPLQVTQATTVAGTPRSGEVLTVTVGAWSPRATTKIEWLRDGKAIPGARQKSYRLQVADEGSMVSVRVTGSRGYFSATPVEASLGSRITPGRLALLRSPVLRRDSLRPRYLVVGGSRFNLRPSSLRYIWSRNGVVIATTSGHRLQVRGKYPPGRFRVVVSARLTEHGRVDAASNAVRMLF